MHRSVTALVAISMAVPAFAATSAVKYEYCIADPRGQRHGSEGHPADAWRPVPRCTVNAGGGARLQNISFGNVDALAINTPTCGDSSSPRRRQVPTNAVYYSDYTGDADVYEPVGRDGTR